MKDIDTSRYTITESGNVIRSICRDCAEIEEPKTRRMTYQELSWWLREKPTREWTFIFQKPARAHTVFEYFDNEAKQPVDEDIIIRENSGEWHEPIVEV